MKLKQQIKKPFNDPLFYRALIFFTGFYPLVLGVFIILLVYIKVEFYIGMWMWLSCLFALGLIHFGIVFLITAFRDFSVVESKLKWLDPDNIVDIFQLFFYLILMIFAGSIAWCLTFGVRFILPRKKA